MSTMTDAGDHAKCPHCGREARVVWVSPDGKTVAIRCMGYHSHDENGSPPRATSRYGPKPNKKYGEGMVFLTEATKK